MKQTMKTELKIFFAWQTSSKTDNLNNKEFIWSCIQKAVNEITGKGDLKDITFKVQQGTGGEPGTPDMIATCLRRNDESHIFIADISVDKRFNKIQKWANRQPKLRERPNENVMYELGRADGHLNYKQVIHVANTVFGDVSKNDYLRPVDIRDKRRPITFKLTSNNAPNAEKVKAELTEDLKTALKKSAKAALDHIHEELKPYESCDQTIKELDFKNKFIYNDYLRSIKRAISESRGILRLYGLNGVGKTRLVLETILSEQTDMPKLYCDCLLTEEQNVLDTTKRIFEKDQSAILILDNCDSDLFTKLLTIYKLKKAQHRLYAIVDVPEESRIDNSYNIARFEYSYEDVVDGIIASQYGKQDEVSLKIKEFASGNPLIAVQTIEGVKKTGDVRGFDNEKLITSILSAAEGSEDRVIAETLSLFSSIGYENDAHKELQTIAINKNITGLNEDAVVLVNKFDAVIKQYLERGLMQKVGAFVRFRSSAISNLLSNSWFSKCTATQLEQLILSLGQMGMANNLVPPFFEKVKDLGNNSRVVDLLKEMLQPGRLLTRKEFLNTEVGSKIYRSLVEVVPEVVCDSLFQTLGGLSLEELKQVRDGRRELVWTLEKLCYKPETFVKAARLMLRLGCSEVEFVSNNATGQFISLFPVRLPSTSVPLSVRLDFLKAEINSPDEKPMVIKALDRALCTKNFIHFGGDTKLGSESYSYYEPQTDKEIEDYISGCLNLVQQEIDGKTEYKGMCIKMLASNLRALNSFRLFDIIMPRVENVAKLLNYDWDDLLPVLHYAKRDWEVKYDAGRKGRIETLIQKLTKTDFVSRFSRVESYEYNDYLGMSDEEHTEAVNTQYEALAEEMANRKLYDIETLKGIYNCQTFLPQMFAIKLASLNTPEEQFKFASDSLDVIGDRINSVFVYFVKEVDEDVFAKIVDQVYARGKQWLMFPLVAVRDYAFDHSYVDKLFELVRQKMVDISLFVTYWNFIRIDRLSTPEAVGLLARILTLPGSFEVVLHMAMSQYLSSEHKNPEMDKLFEEEIIKRAGYVSKLIINYHYSHILSVLLSSGKKEKLAGALANGIFHYVITSDDTSLRYEVENVIKLLFEKYFAITWKIMSGLMSTKENEENFVKLYFAFGFNMLHNPFPALIFNNENLTMVMDWCKSHSDVGPYRLMALAPLMEGDKLSEPVMMLIDNYGSDKMVRTALSDKLGTFSSPVTHEDRAELIVPLLKHKNPDVSTWATLEIERLKYYGKQSRKMEENYMLSGRLPGHGWTLNDEEGKDFNK